MMENYFNRPKDMKCETVTEICWMSRVILIKQEKNCELYLLHAGQHFSSGNLGSKMAH